MVIAAAGAGIDVGECRLREFPGDYFLIKFDWAHDK
jgi:hypothetical protein